MSTRIMSIPAGHPYPRALQPEGGWVDITVLPDPVVNPDDPGQWWPHPAFTPQWWETPRDIDLVHVHFGFEHLTYEETALFTQVLRENGIPLVLTVHDLDNPHLEDQTDYHRQLRLLIDAAAHVFTLSEGAGEVVDKQFGRRTEVTPHPAITAGHTPPGTGRAGVFLKSVRANVVADPQFYRDLGAELYIHHGAAPTLENLADHVHAPMDDQTLYAAIVNHPVVVLPYLRGTHSGWLRMCRDLGVSVAVPDCGCYDSQMPGDVGVAAYRTGDGLDAARVVEYLKRQGPVPTPPIIDVSAQHRRVYLNSVGAR